MKKVRYILSLPFIGLIRLYQWGLSPLIGPKCRYTPTCSTTRWKPLKNMARSRAAGWLLKE